MWGPRMWKQPSEGCPAAAWLRGAAWLHAKNPS